MKIMMWLVLALACLSQSASADSSWVDERYFVLKGIRKVRIKAWGISALESRIGLTEEAILKRVTRQFKQSGITVDTARRDPVPRNTANLYLHVLTSGPSYAILLQHHDWVTFGNRNLEGLTVAWQAYEVGTHDKKPGPVFATIDKLVKGFIKDLKRQQARERR